MIDKSDRMDGGKDLEGRDNLEEAKTLLLPVATKLSQK